MPPPERTIQLLWTCGMGEHCTNATRPGIHSGDDGYDEAGECRGIPRPVLEKPAAPSLKVGRKIPVSAGAA